MSGRHFFVIHDIFPATLNIKKETGGRRGWEKGINSNYVSSYNLEICKYGIYAECIHSGAILFIKKSVLFLIVIITINF